MARWDELLKHLAEVPRENGTAALDQTASFLLEFLQRSGVAAERVAFAAEPYGLRLAGVVALTGGLLYARLMWGGRHGWALVVALALPALMLAQLELHIPLVSWIGAREQHHVVARFPVENAQQRLLFTAHYDTKTDALDHVQRAPVERAALPVAFLMILGAGAALWGGSSTPLRRRLARGMATLGGLLGVALFVTLSAGAFVPRRSPGALDDGGACAVLARLALEIAGRPALERTQVEIALLSAEEVGRQGSLQFVALEYPEPPTLPTFVVNLEGIGSSRAHAVLGHERSTLSDYPPDPRIVELLDEQHRERFGTPLVVTPFGGATDAHSFLAAGIPAATLVSAEPGVQFTRGLHSWRDSRDRIDEDALDGTLDYLLGFVLAADAHGLQAP
jgi:acetylornithine deacetylase/succinyl-diaminopimelate desuccinylase-like protein